MGLFTKKRRDAKWIKPKDSIQAIVPYIMPKRCDAEVSSTVNIDITKLVDFVDEQNKNDLGYKMTYFHALSSCFAKTVFNRPALNRFVKNKRLYERNKVTFAFIAKDKLSDKGEERIISVDIDPKDNIMTYSKRVAIDVFKVRKEGSNDMDDVLGFFSSLPKWLLTIIVKIVFFLDNHGINPEAITKGDTNYATILLSNLGSIKTNSIYHHLNEYGTNSVIITIGTIREEKGKKMVDITATLDERIADGFYFAKSIQLAEYIAKNPELLLEDFEKKVEIKDIEKTKQSDIKNDE